MDKVSLYMIFFGLASPVFASKSTLQDHSGSSHTTPQTFKYRPPIDTDLLLQKLKQKSEARVQAVKEKKRQRKPKD